MRGEYKRLRETLRRQQKDSQRLDQNLIAYAQQEKNFKQTDWTVFPRATFLQQQYYLTKQRTLLDVEKARLVQLRNSLQTKQAELDARCQQPDAQQKIEGCLIADAILREPQAVQLVALSTGNNLGMEKDWELMSELDKDALLHKKIVREL